MPCIVLKGRGAYIVDEATDASIMALEAGVVWVSLLPRSALWVVTTFSAAGPPVGRVGRDILVACAIPWVSTAAAKSTACGVGGVGMAGMVGVGIGGTVGVGIAGIVGSAVSIDGDAIPWVAIL